MFFIATHGQTVLIDEDFESYTDGGFLVQQAGNPWTTWSNQPGGAEDAVISTVQANSPTKSVHIQNASDDIILKLGNKTSGKYSVEFYYFIPTGYGAYFNIQHFEAPGTEWAMETYFGNNGTGNTVVNSVEENFSHAMDTWLQIELVVDLDLDSAWFYLNGSLIRGWIFSMQASAPTGTKQLGGINFYGGAITGQTPQYFFDDVTFTQVVAGSNPPEIQLSTTNIATDGSANEVFTISNLGDQQMTFIAYPTYPQGGTKALSNETSTLVSIGYNNAEGFDKTDKANELSYVVGLLTGGVGFASTINGVRSAVVFDYNFINQYIGRELVSITIGVNDLPSGTTKVQVWGRGSYTTPGAGTLIDEKNFTATTIGEEITVTLDSPIYLDGNEIWLGWVGDALASTYPIGIDEGPRFPGVNWLAVGPGWSEMSPTIDNNLYIMGTLQGSSLYQWLSVSPQSGTINGGGNQSITASFNTTGMTNGNYYAEIVIGCNDQTQEYSEVEVYLTIGASVNEYGENVAVMTFPNPVSEMFNINANTSLLKVEVYSITGQIVKAFAPATDNFSFSVNDLSAGIYTVIISTEKEKVERKIVVE